MSKMIASIALGSALVFTALPAFAQTGQSTVPAVNAPAATTQTGSYKSQAQHRANASRKTAKASAHHKMAKAPAHHKMAKAPTHRNMAKVSAHHIRQAQPKTVNS